MEKEFILFVKGVRSSHETQDELNAAIKAQCPDGVLENLQVYRSVLNIEGPMIMVVPEGVDYFRFN